MNGLDWAVIVAYLGAMIGFSVYLGRGQESQDDYYVGGRNIPWWAVGISTMATQTSAVGFISVPAFVALAEGGGLTLLQNELAVPLAMIAIMVLLIPLFRRLELISIFEYLERRFGPGTRNLLAAVFLISRGLATGIGVYAAAIVLAVCFGTDEWVMILVIGIITIIYDTIGGMKAVVYSDVIQMVILIGGLVLCIGYALKGVGGWDAAVAAHDPARLVALDLSWGMSEESRYPFWGFMIGGLFLYMSYYGCDQSQVQRELSAPTLAATKYSLVFNGFARLPMGVAYAVLGIAVGAAVLSRPELMAEIPDGKPDYMVPVFVLHALPHGLKALIFAAILAAAMSSLDSALNSLSASTMQDFVERYLARDTRVSYVTLSKLTTVVWGVLIIGFAFVLGGEETGVARVNKIGSAFYGPILAAFVVGVTLRFVSGPAMVAGIVAGVGLNMVLWFAVPDLFWMWWNATGCVVAVVVAMGVAVFVPQRWGDDSPRDLLVWDTLDRSLEIQWLPLYGALVVYFGLIVALCALAPRLLGVGS